MNEKQLYYYKDFRKIVEEAGYKLISTEYINSNTHYVVECPNCHQYKVLMGNFKKGKRCAECQGIKTYTKEDILLYLNNYNIKLIDFGDYKNVFSKLIVECQHGHVTSVSFRDLCKSKHKCSICANIIQGQKKKLSYEYVNDYFKKYNYILISNTYASAKSPLEVECPSGHTTTISFDKFRGGHRCWECYILNNVGENHPNWMGGVSSTNSNIRASNEYIEWRDAIFKRDNYTCQVCNKRGGVLNAHHLYSFANNPELRFDINNGITICEEHHLQSIKGSFHNIYTQFNNAPEQFEEYIQRYKNGEFDELRKLNNETS